MNIEGICSNCENCYRTSNNNCYKIIEKCNSYEEDENCKECNKGYAFEETNRLICKDTKEFEE